MDMDSELIARIGPGHRRRLAWFEEHQGEVSPSPAPLDGGLRLVSAPKGIYKPADLPYALSIKIKLDSPYRDGVPVPTSGGGWLLEYHQENADPAARDTMFTNRGLMRCIADRIPVGVLRERAPATRHSRYDVLGLALPVSWSDGRFYFESLNPRAMPVVDPVSDVMEAIAGAEVDQQAAAEGGSLDDDYDARLRVVRQIVARRGQAGFRASLLEAYGGRCAVTGFDAAPALEGAHLRPYRGPDSNHVTNGLLLRADIRTLFDLGLLAPDPVTRIITVSKLLAGTQYELLSGSRLADPVEAWQRPNQEALEITWQRFREAEDDR
jgi:putative restriction endonuclease